jgi:hypothetical protein
MANGEPRRLWTTSRWRASTELGRSLTRCSRTPAESCPRADLPPEVTGRPDTPELRSETLVTLVEMQPKRFAKQLFDSMRGACDGRTRQGGAG